MAVSNIKAVFRCDIKKVWDVVTNLEDYSWRSDLNSIEILSNSQFVEHTKDGYQTKFTIIAAEPYHRWEFNMENDYMRGSWTGIFSQNGSESTINFTENVIAKKILMKPFVRAYLKKQQSAYVADLSRRLNDK